MVKNTIIYLIGYPGVGKYTTAKALCALDDNIKLVDNHLINNPVFSLIEKGGGTTIPAEVWDLIRPIRASVLETIRTQSPDYYSFVFTNNLANDEEDRGVYNQIVELAKTRDAKLVPVFLTCDLGVNRDRIASQDRVDRFKMTCPDKLEEARETYEELKVDDPNKLEINITHSSPDKTAQIIFEHIKGLP